MEGWHEQRIQLDLRAKLSREIELLEQAGYVQVEKEARAGPIVMQLGNVLLVNNCEDKWSVASAIES